MGTNGTWFGCLDSVTADQIRANCQTPNIGYNLANFNIGQTGTGYCCNANNCNSAVSLFSKSNKIFSLVSILIVAYFFIKTN